MRRPLLVFVVALLVALPVVAQPPSVAAATNATFTAESRYRLDPNAGKIAVSRDLVVKNLNPDRRSGGRITRTSVTGVRVWVEKEAVAFHVTADSGKVTTKAISSGDRGRTVELDFAPIWFGQTRKLQVSYDIPGGAARSSSPIRAGKAYANFCAVAAGTTGGSLAVAFPPGYKVVQDRAMSASTSGGLQLFSSGNLTDPSSFGTCFQATNESAATHESVTAGGRTFTIEAWPDDPTWAAEVKREIETGVPKLLSLTGLQVPGGGPVKAIEVSDGNWAGGYVGQFGEQDRALYAVEHVDARTIVHELSHMWFNSDRFAQTWMAEGLAGYAEEAAGGTCTEPANPGNGSTDLTNWKTLPASPTAADRAMAAFDYQASCWIFTDLAKQMGPDRFRDVLAATWNGEIPYQAAGQPETVAAGKQVGPQRLLDLLDERGLRPAGVADLNLAQGLFAKYGILTDTSALSARSAARRQYAGLEALAGAWQLPLAIREPMTEWRFAVAQSAMDTAARILALRNQTASSVSGVSLDGSTLRQAFESARDQTALDAVLDQVQGLSGAASKVAAAQRAYDAQRGPVEALGLIGSDAGATLTKAKAALRDGDAEGATAAADSVVSTIDRATSAGILRISLGLFLTLALVLVLMLLVAFARWRATRRTEAAARH